MGGWEGGRESIEHEPSSVLKEVLTSHLNLSSEHIVSTLALMKN